MISAVLFLALFSTGELSWFYYTYIIPYLTIFWKYGSMFQLSLGCFAGRPFALEAMLRNMV